MTLFILKKAPYNFQSDWLVELSDNKPNNKLNDNKLVDKNLASELVENRSLLKPITTKEIAFLLLW